MSVAPGEHQRFLRLGLLLLYVSDSCPRGFGIYGLGEAGEHGDGEQDDTTITFLIPPFEHFISQDLNCRRRHR